jgi:hypothetical protein
LRRVDELLGRIDEVAPAVCGWCSTPLDPGSGSLDFCSPSHQQQWQERHQQVKQLGTYREAADPLATDAAQHVGGVGSAGSFEDCECGLHGSRMPTPTLGEVETALFAIPLEILMAAPVGILTRVVFLAVTGAHGQVEIAPTGTPENSPLWRDIPVGAVTVRFHPATPRQPWWRRLVKTGRHR